MTRKQWAQNFEWRPCYQVNVFFFSPLLKVLPLYCSCAHTFESFPQKSPSLLCCAKEEQSRGFLEGTFKPMLLLYCKTAIKQQDRRQRASFLYLLFEGDNPAYEIVG